MRYTWYWWHTVDAVVRSVEVGGEVLGAGLNASTKTWYGYLTPRAACTGGVQQVDDVGRTADEAVVSRHTSAQFLTTITCLIHDDQLTVRTRCVERLELTVLATLCAQKKLQHKVLHLRTTGVTEVR